MSQDSRGRFHPFSVAGPGATVEAAPDDQAWRERLRAGDPAGAWDLFVARYRRLMIAVIRKLVRDDDDVMDVLSSVCESLGAGDCARLRRFEERPHTARVSTWLVAVVRNLTIDWLRTRDGRRRVSIPSALTPLGREIYAEVFLGGRSHVEAFEIIASRRGSAISFQEFQREVRATYRLAPIPRHQRLRIAVRDAAVDSVAAPAEDVPEREDSARHLAKALASLTPDVRLAVQLFVIEGMPAGEVAIVLGWPNGKRVYNSVYRALTAMRASLRREGVGPGDL